MLSVLPRLLAQNWPALLTVIVGSFLLTESTLQKTERIHHARILTGSEFLPLPKILHCWPPWKPGPYLSSGVAGQTPITATHYGLGELLPHLLPLRRRQTVKRRIYPFLSYSVFDSKSPSAYARSSKSVHIVLLTRSPLDQNRSRTTHMCKIEFQRSFGAKIKPINYLTENKYLRYL